MGEGQARVKAGRPGQGALATQVRVDIDGYEKRGSGEKWAVSGYTFGIELTVSATVLKILKKYSTIY